MCLHVFISVVNCVIICGPFWEAFIKKDDTIFCKISIGRQCVLTCSTFSFLKLQRLFMYCKTCIYCSMEEFINECVERLSNELEYILYFGVYPYVYQKYWTSLQAKPR